MFERGVPEVDIQATRILVLCIVFAFVRLDNYLTSPDLSVRRNRFFAVTLYSEDEIFHWSFQQ